MDVDYGVRIGGYLTCTPFPDCFVETPYLTPSTPGVSGVLESSTVATGFVYTFEAVSAVALMNTFRAFQIGEIVFSVNSSVATNGSDAFSGFFNAGSDGAYDNGGLPVSSVYPS